LYYDLASTVGCGSTGAVLDCLRSVNSTALQLANSNISTSQTYGTWAYLPVTDYSFITTLPSVALNSKKVSGQSILVGNNANEGPLFVPPTISTLDDLKAWLKLEFPTFSSADIQNVLDAYPSGDGPVNASDPKYATNGVDGATALNVSQVATGHQQRANNIYAEATFICPSYWLNTAYSTKTSFHYQYSVPFGSHAEDVTAYFGPAALNQPPVFSSVFQKILGNFIINSSPAIPDDQATARWPAWVGGEESRMVNLNTTGGVPYQVTTQFGANVTQFMDPGVKNAFSTANAHTWEGGRGMRCDFWKTMASKIPI
jgi:carboxylesterase type B